LGNGTSTFDIHDEKENPVFIIQLTEFRPPTGTVYIAERDGEFFLTPDKAQATRYPTELDAKVARTYIGDEYEPVIVPAS
jgi:hypothetical protein